MQVIKKHLLLLPILLFCCVLPSAAQNAADNAAAAGTEQKKEPVEDKFEYQMEGRPDPFYSFVTQEDKKKKIDEEIDPEDGKPLTGMQLIEPGQLKLAAVLHTQDGYVAMAEKATGEGLILKEKMLIGRRGQIVKIEDGKVLIKETFKTTSGKEKTNDIVMNLKKEGEQ